MTEFTDVKESKDLSNKRSLTLDNGNKIHFERTDPYGFWKVHYDKGQMPDKLTGYYTSFDRAKQAVDAYVAELKEAELKKPKKQSNAA